MKKKKKKNPAPKDDFDKSFDELVSKGFIEEVGVGPDGEPEYRLTHKSDNYQNTKELLEWINQNSPEEIRKRIAKNN